MIGRVSRTRFLLYTIPVLFAFVVVEVIAIFTDNFWDPLQFWGLQIASMVVAILLWLIVAGRCHDVGIKAWLPLTAIVFTLISKFYVSISWISATSREFEMFAGLWIVIVEPKVHFILAIISLFVVFRPPQTGLSKYGPNPNEVTS